ncbi:hypothetical protein BDV93DRAFT_602766 [Ceratobasidium sp. AG-I]|nr:hypothetical protein BDV93DRAFT_602766 [Ceratobasidium sp. AG-I]
MANQVKGGATRRKRAMSSAPPASLDTCVITYLVEGRAFQRIFEESNIDDMKDVIRQKLSLDPNVGIKLAQRIEDRRIDLEDEHDFNAFQVGTFRKQEISVEASILTPPPAQLASPSVTSSSINFDPHSTKHLAAPGDSSLARTITSATTQSSNVEANPEPAPKKTKKTKLAAATIHVADNAEESSTKLATAKDKGKGKQVDLPDLAPTAQVIPLAAQPVLEPPKSKARRKAKKNAGETTTPLPAAPASQPSKKPKSKAASTLTPATEPELQPLAVSEQQTATQTVSSAPAKTKKGKKASATQNPPDNDDPSAHTQGQPSNEGESAIADVSTVSAAQDANVSQSLPKKRGRKSVAEAPEAPTATTSTGADETMAPIDAAGQPPPAKKRRKSKVERAEEYGPVAVTLPGPGPSRRKSLVAASTDRPVIAPRKSVDAYADIVQRWVSDASASKSQGSIASGSGTGGSESAAPAIAPTPDDAPGATTEDQTDGKKKSKKKKKAITPVVPVTVEIPTGVVPADSALCLVCQTTPPNPHMPLECPILSHSGADAINIVEQRVADLAATQGPTRVHQMLISRLRDWIKGRKKEDEAQAVFTPAVASTPAPTKSALKSRKSATAEPLGLKSQPMAGPSRPLFPKKSKLSSVAVSRQSEGSSTEDEDILNSVMRHGSDSDAESAEGGESDEEMADVTVEKQSQPVTTPLAGEPSTPVTPSTSSTPASSASPPVVLRPLSPNPADAIRPSQRMSQSNVLALLDDLEAEEAGQAKQSSDSDTEGSELARSTPSDVVRRRHRKSVRIETNDSDADDEDIEMGDPNKDSGAKDDTPGDNDQGPNDNPGGLESLRLSQAPKSPQSLGRDTLHLKQEDDIEEYESDAGDDKVVPEEESSSSIESPSDPDPRRNETSSREEKPLENEQASSSEAEEDGSEAAPNPPPKRRGRPPLSQAVKDERAAQKARILAEKLATRTEGSKKRGRPSLSQPQSEATEQKEPSSTNKVATPPTEDPVNVSSISAVSVTTSKPNANTMSVEIPAPKTRSRSLSRAASSQAKPDLSQSSIPSSQDAPAPKKRGRPPLSQAILAEREAERERVRAEKAIQKLEKRTAKANAKRSKDSKGPDPASDAEDDTNLTANTTAPIMSPSVPDSTAQPEEEPGNVSYPGWEVLKASTSSSRPGSSQVDELEASVADGVDAGESHTGNGRPSSQKISSSMKLKSRQSEDELEDMPDINSRASNGTSLSRPLFMPSSGLVKKTASRPVLPPSSPLVSTPAWTNRAPPLSQQTPIGTIARRPSISTASLPRFSAIKQSQELMRQSRRASRLLSSQPVKLEPSQEQQPDDEVMLLDESSSDGDSSGKEGNATVTQSQRKRRSAFDYFTKDP